LKVKSLCVAVTGLNASDSPGPGVSVIRSIRASEDFHGEVVGLSYDPLDPGFYIQGICDHGYLVPYPSQGGAALLERLREIHRCTPLDVIIPTLDSELPSFLSIEGDLKDQGIRLFLPHERDLESCSKARLPDLLKRGVQVPQGRSITDVASLYRLEQSFQFPLMVKGRFYEADIVYSAIGAERCFRRLADKWGLPVIVQEFIQGEEYDVAAIGDGKGGLVGAVPMRKMQLTDKGKAWGGVTIQDTNLEEFVRETIAKLKWRGPCELEVIKSQKDGSYYLIELNPRFPAWCYLTVGAGQNLPWAAVRLALNQSVEPLPPHKAGVMFLRHSIDMVYPLSHYESITTRGEIHHSQKETSPHA
jgi:carbamoyl-phosphate synthase large subunit